MWVPITRKVSKIIVLNRSLVFICASPEMQSLSSFILFKYFNILEQYTPKFHFTCILLYMSTIWNAERFGIIYTILLFSLLLYFSCIMFTGTYSWLRGMWLTKGIRIWFGLASFDLCLSKNWKCFALCSPEKMTLGKGSMEYIFLRSLISNMFSWST